jgi:CRP-like cAMP-binding protein
MARKDDKLDQLGRMWLFSACSKRDLQLIGRASDEVTVEKGKQLTEEGRPGHEFYLILDGQAVVKSKGKKVATLAAGQYFGELSLLHKGPRNATVTAESDMRLLVLGQREFNGLLDEVPGLAHKVLRTMATRLREADAKAIH